MPINETSPVQPRPKPARAVFDPFDRSPREARTERNARIPNDTPEDMRQERRDIVSCFRQDRYGR